MNHIQWHNEGTNDYWFTCEKGEGKVHMLGGVGVKKMNPYGAQEEVITCRAKLKNQEIEVGMCSSQVRWQTPEAAHRLSC